MRLAQGQTVDEICRQIGISEQSYYRWRRECGGLKLDQAQRLKDLKRENGRLRQAVNIEGQEDGIEDNPGIEPQR